MRFDGVLTLAHHLEDFILALIGGSKWPRHRPRFSRYARDAVPRSLDGSAHDHVQHDHRTAPPRRNGRAGSDTFAVCRRQTISSRAARFRRRVARFEATDASRSRREYDVGLPISTPRTCSAGHPGRPIRQVRDVTTASPARDSLCRTTRIEERDASALAYMDLKRRTPIEAVSVDRVFIGSCTNWPHRRSARRGRGRQGRTSPADVHAMVVPGSGLVKRQAEDEGLDRVFQGRRVRVARSRLQHVPGHESRQARAGQALRFDRATATSKAVRARADARTWFRRPWPPPPPSPAILSTSAEWELNR